MGRSFGVSIHSNLLFGIDHPFADCFWMFLVIFTHVLPFPHFGWEDRAGPGFAAGGDTGAAAGAGGTGAVPKSASLAGALHALCLG